MFNTWIDSFECGNNNNDRGCGNNERGDREDDRDDSREDYNDNNREGHGNGRGHDKKSKLSYNPDKYCERYNRRGHNTDEYLILKKETHETESDNQHTNTSNYQSNYQSNFNHHPFNAQITRLIVNNIEIQHNNSQDWIIDSAANVYITSFKENLHNYREYSNQNVQIKEFVDKAEIVRGKGIIILTNIADNRFILKDVVYNPENPDQILSLMKLRREKQADFHFTAVEDFIISLSKDISFPGKSINDICHIWISSSLQIKAVNTRSVFRKRKSDNDDNHDIKEQSSASNKPIKEHQLPHAQTTNFTPLQCISQNLWHLHFDHTSSIILYKHLYIKSNHDSTHCVVCIRAKQIHKPFYHSKNKVTRKFERIHSDLCGLFSISKSKSIYLLTFLDELTHWCWITTIADKTSATICREYRNLIKQIEMEIDLKIKYLWTDDDKKYEEDLTSVLKELGVKHESTSPHSSQSNRKAERLNQTLEEHARAMLYQANMLKSFWTETITTTAYFLNRLSSDAINDISYELWYNRWFTTINLKALKSFDCIMHACIPKKWQKKLDKIDIWSNLDYFIGYINTNTMHKNLELRKEEIYKLRVGPYSVPRMSESDDRFSSWIYDEIIVQQSSALQVFKIYEEFQSDNDPPFFADAMCRSDANL